MDNELPKRKNIRLKSDFYNLPGTYFVTFCTYKRRCCLSTVGAIHESPANTLSVKGIIVEDVIKNIPDTLGVLIDKYVIMPNHVHIIFVITQSLYIRAIRESPLRSKSTISNAVGYIKMNAAKKIKTKDDKDPVFQRSFYDHIIRNKKDYDEIVKYIYDNPKNWYYDELYAED